MRSKNGLILGVTLFLCIFALSVIYKFDNKILILATGLGSLGALANLFIVSVNGGKMPIVLTPKEAQKFKDKNYCIANAQTRYAWLADRLRLFGRYSFSMGDLLMAAGVLLTIFAL
jgi:hypothetical protein